jgi:fructose-specific phosphotransferase system IIA component
LPSLESLTSSELIFPDLQATDAQSVLRELAEKVSARGLVAESETLFQRLWEREQLGSTAIGHGVAIPHCKLNGLPRVVVAVGVSRRGVDFGAADGQAVRLFFLVASPSRSPAEHLQSLAAISKWVKGGGQVERILAAPDVAAITAAIRGEAG